MTHTHEDTRYVILPASAAGQVDYSDVMETGPQTLRASVDGGSVFVKYEGPQPPSVQVIGDTVGEYTHSEFATLLNSDDWTTTDDI